MNTTTTKTNDVAQGTSLDDSLKQTELGNVILENKNLVISLVVLLLFGVVGYGVYTNQVEKSNNKNANTLYVTETGSFKKFKEKSLGAPEMVGEMERLSKELGSFKGFGPFAIQVADEMMAQGAQGEAKTVLGLAQTNSGNALIKYLSSMRMAVVMENLGDIDGAINELESLLNAKERYMEGKVYLDLGRLYLKKGNQEKAKSNLEHAVEVAKEDEFKKLAKLLLGELN